ncbi:MAG: DUF222 domain-containing protein [Pseudolysinimonas sp.]
MTSTSGEAQQAPSEERVTALLDALAAVERATSSYAAVRAQLVDELHREVTEVERAHGASTASGAPASAATPAPIGPPIAEQARRLVVAELAALLRISSGSAAHLVAESRVLSRQLPATLGALATGEISYGHATVVVDNATSLPDEALPEFERAVLPEAVRLNPARFRDRARRIRERHHPESLRVRRAAQVDRRSVAVEPARDGMAWLTLYGPAEKVIAIDDRLDRMAVALRSPDDPRTFAQQKADAFCDLLIDGAVPGTSQSGIRAQVLVEVPVLTLLRLDDEPATLEGYGPIPDDVARQLAAEAPSFVRLLTHPETGAVLSVGRDRYSIPADMRLFLRARDETCRGVGCGRRAGTSDVDHGQEWADGGQTAVDNLAHLCRGHHTRKTTLRWGLRHLPGGTLEWTSPFGRTYRTEPSRVLRT